MKKLLRRCKTDNEFRWKLIKLLFKYDMKQSMKEILARRFR